MRSLSPDVVIAFEEPFGLFALQSVAAARHCVPAAPIVLYSWDNMSGGVSYPYRPKTLYRLIERWVMPRISVLLTANKEAYDRFAAMYTTPISLVYFGIDMKGFGDQRKPDRDQPKDPARFCVGYLGRLLPMKGVDTLVDALPLLPSHVHVSIVGNGPDLPRLKERVRNQRGENRIAFQRAVNSERVKDILSTFDVLVLPSRTTPRWKEQYGRVLIEAMASGVPVIGSDSGAIPEVIGDAGLIYPEGDARALAHSIRQFLSDDGLRDRLSRAGMRRAQRFSAVTFAEEMYRLLGGLARAQ